MTHIEAIKRYTQPRGRGNEDISSARPSQGNAFSQPREPQGIPSVTLSATPVENSPKDIYELSGQTHLPQAYVDNAIHALRQKLRQGTIMPQAYIHQITPLRKERRRIAKQKKGGDVYARKN